MAAKVGLLSLPVVNSSATDIVFVTVQAQKLKQQLRSAQVAGRGDTALTLPLFWRRSTVSPVFFGRYPRSSLHSFAPFPPPPPPPPPPPSPSLISHIASVDVKQNGPLKPLLILTLSLCEFKHQMCCVLDSLSFAHSSVQ